MLVRDGMTASAVTVGPSHSLKDAAEAMAQRNVGAAIVVDPEQPGPGIITERDILRSVAAGEDPSAERVAAHLTSTLVFAAPDWSLEEAAVAMVRGKFRHLIVIESGEVVGILSVRDIVRVWSEDGAICEMPPAVRVA